MKKIVLLVVILFVGMFSVSAGSAQVSRNELVPGAIQKAVEQALTENLGFSPPYGILIENLVQAEGWTFGTVVILTPPDTDAIPDGRLFLSRSDGRDIQIALDYTPLFMDWLPEVPESIISEESLYYLGTPGNDMLGDGSAQLSLPFGIHETWRLTGGPHHNCGWSWQSCNDNDDRPWSAIDLNISPGVSGNIRAARDGTAYVMCGGALVRIDHGGGWSTQYFHITSIQVGNNKPVTRGQWLGKTSTSVGTCTGSADGVHLHFALKKNGQFVDIHNKDIGGWNVQQGSSQYQGKMTRNGITANINGLVWNDGGIGSACPLGQMQATFFNGKTLSGNPTAYVCQGTPRFNWGSGGPGNGVGSDNFSIRWSGQFNFSSTRTNLFTTRTDDGVRLWLDNVRLLDKWQDMAPTTYRVAYTVPAGVHTVLMEYYENGGGAEAQLSWGTNLAQSRPAYATGVEGSNFVASRGNDGSYTSRYSSDMSGGDEWWIVDLGTQTFNRVRIKWEAAYAASHFIGWSNDGVNFSGYWYSIGSAGTYQYSLGTRTYRYVGLLMRTRAPCCGNFSFFELEVFNTSGLEPLGEVDTLFPVEPTETIEIRRD